MARIAGVNIPREKRVPVGLTYIFGIGRNLALKIVEKANINPQKRVHELSDEEVNAIQRVVQEYKVEGELRRTVREDIQRLKATGSYRGHCHKRGLPVRGQRTRTNARTKKGKRVPVGGKKKVIAKK